MSVKRLATAALCGALMGAPALGQISDLTNWDFYRDPSDPSVNDAMTGSAATNLAQLNFINNVDIPAAYDIGFSSVNANTVAQATSGYYFDASQDFALSLDFAITLTNPNGVVALGLGVGEDRAGVNAAGIGLGLASFGFTAAAFQGAATNNDSPLQRSLDNPVAPFVTGTTYSGTLGLAYDAATGNITVSATGASGSGSTTFNAATDLDAWVGDNLLVSFFLRSDSVTTPIAVGPWTGQSAEADFLNLTVTQGSATLVPEPASLALLGLGAFLTARTRR